MLPHCSFGVDPNYRSLPHPMTGSPRLTTSIGVATPYPPRPQLRPLPEFVGTAWPACCSGMQARVERFVLERYAAGR